MTTYLFKVLLMALTVLLLTNSFAYGNENGKEANRDGFAGEEEDEGDDEDDDDDDDDDYGDDDDDDDGDENEGDENEDLEEAPRMGEGVYTVEMVEDYYNKFTEFKTAMERFLMSLKPNMTTFENLKSISEYLRTRIEPDYKADFRNLRNADQYIYPVVGQFMKVASIVIDAVETTITDGQWNEETESFRRSILIQLGEDYSSLKSKYDFWRSVV
ncbi:hypothetical protein CRM22_011271 [Opisthorchis felineus]|uniref:Uncharacterized protein n=1 Tax=Opisthorchis felineus TaxID=147828 RepID=A0A4S2JWQ8_OPIFE|nr:hypothetical protein CRM22_011271 [Opisthorchis felineus]